jgi:hypothetical protein
MLKQISVNAQGARLGLPKATWIKDKDSPTARTGTAWLPYDRRESADLRD